MSDYDDDFEDFNDTLNDRSKQGTTKQPKTERGKTKPNNKITAKNSSYDNTLARDKTLGIKPKEYKKPKPPAPYPPNTIKSKPNKLGEGGIKPKGLSNKSGIYSSTPNLKNNRRSSKKSLLTGDGGMSTTKKLHNFGLTKKAQQTLKPSK